ncbi:MAG: cupin domain-containing protein [Acidobacteria bacterium]|nr:cupin domain-containing protein [Acidobacteriota bacterium]
MLRRILAEASGFGLETVEVDAGRPWGAFVRFSETSLAAFLSAYWETVDLPPTRGRRDPKILLMAPGEKLSLQYHNRRDEWWRVLEGPVAVSLGEDPTRLSEHVLPPGAVIHLPRAALHRAGSVGQSWGRIAEIWEHVVTGAPSDEDDIVRVQDDYGRRP